MADTQAIDVKTRGLVFAVLAGWIKEKQGEDSFEDVARDLSPKTFDLLRSAQKGKWYLLEELTTLLEACGQKTDSPQNAWAEFGAYLCEVSLTTSFRGLIVFIDPVTLMKRMPLFWKRYFNAGDIRAEDVQPGKATLALAEPIGGEVITVMFTGWLRQALKMIGATGIEARGSDCCWQVSWEYKH